MSYSPPEDKIVYLPDIPPLSRDTILLSSAHEIQTCEISDGALKYIKPHHIDDQGKEKGDKGDE